MRISGGKYVNKKIITHDKKVNEDVDFRATAERTRQAIFNIIQNASFIPENFLDGAVVADIYCGCGSFGLEALSRGAKKAIFVDQSPKQLEIVKTNLEALNEASNAKLIRADATLLPKMDLECKIVYLDPPYNINLVNPTLKSIANSGWLSKEHLIIVESAKQEDVKESDKLKILDVRTYGKSKVTFCYFSSL